jgi:hypothetical protein
LRFARASRFGSTRAVLADGPPECNAKDVANSRYFITDLVNDIRSLRSGSEFIGTVTRLYRWLRPISFVRSGYGLVDADFANELASAFQAAFENGAVESVIRLCERVLQASGGWLF